MKKERSVEQVFPDPKARRAADAAIDKLDVHEPMTTWIDTWIAEYVAAGGKTTIGLA